MTAITKRQLIIFFLILIVVMVSAYLIDKMTAPPPTPLKPAPATNSTDYITVKDNTGKVILETGLPVFANDEYICENNVHYIIKSVSGNQAVAEIKEEQTTSDTKKMGLGALAAPKNSISAQAFVENELRHMVIYHTHNDECYKPTSGVTARPGKGDIYKVGAALSEALEMGGINTSHSYKKHDPHDINAYHRSRRTALQLLKRRPDAAFDLHRDSAPRRAYLTLVNGIETGRVMIVVGRSNPNMKANLEYAKKIKAKADELHPGLMRGIFLGRGDYNQDLYPTSLLFEVGTKDNTLTEAKRAVRCLADAIIRVPIK